jgi:hypothetical protein
MFSFRKKTRKSRTLASRDVVSQDTGFQPFVRLRRCDGRVYSAADQFLREVDSLRKEILSQRESRKRAQPRSTNTPTRARVVLETGIASTTESTDGVGITRVSFKPVQTTRQIRPRSARDDPAVHHQEVNRLAHVSRISRWDYCVDNDNTLILRDRVMASTQDSRTDVV